MYHNISKSLSWSLSYSWRLAALASLNSLCHTTSSHSSRPSRHTLPHCHRQAPISPPLSLSLTIDLSNLSNSQNLLTSGLFLLCLTHPLLSLFRLLCSVCYFCFWVCVCVYIYIYIYIWIGCVGMGRGRGGKNWIFEKYSSPKPVKPILYTAPHCTTSITAKLRFVAVIVLIKLHHKIQC